MGSDLSSDLGLGILAPSAAVRPAQGQSPNQDAESKARRQPRPKDDKDDTPSEDAGDSAHQLDHLA